MFTLVAVFMIVIAIKLRNHFIDFLAHIVYYNTLFV